MNERDHPVDDAVRRMAEHIEPSEAERQNAKDRLRAAIKTELPHQRHRWLRPAGWRWVAAAAAIFVSLLFGLQLVRPSATEAAMEEIAKTVEALDPVDVPDQEFLYTDTVVTSLVEIPAEMLTSAGFEGDALAYLLPTRRETWYGDDNTVQLRTTNQPPVFFAKADEDAYYTAGIDDLDMIGETTTDTFTDPRDFDAWPTAPDALDEAIRERIPPGSSESEDALYVEITLGLIREVFTPPELRAATLTLIGRISSLELLDETESQTTFAIDYKQDDGAVRHTFTVTSDGALVSEEIRLLEPDPQLGIPATTAILTAEHTTPVIVDTLDAP